MGPVHPLRSVVEQTLHSWGPQEEVHNSVSGGGLEDFQWNHEESGGVTQVMRGMGRLGGGDCVCKGLDVHKRQRELKECGREGAEQTEGLSLPTVEEGPVFAICVAGAHDQATLAKWIQGLQETNPALARIPVVFRLSGSSGELLASSDLEEPPPPPPEGQEEDDTQQRQQQGQS